MTFLQIVSHTEQVIIAAMVASTLASLIVLLRLLNTAGRDFDDNPALVEKFRRDAPYHLLKEVLIPPDQA